MKEAAGTGEEREAAIGRAGRLRLGLVTIAAELLALGLLWLRVGILRSLGLPVALAFLVLNRRRVVRGTDRLVQDAGRAMCALRRMVVTVKARALSRRTWRFRVSTLLLAVLLIALPCAWFGHQSHRVERERDALDGTWRVLDWRDGSPIRVRGRPITVELGPGKYEVDPSRRPGWIDFHVLGTSRVSRAIYEWDGGRLRVCQDSGGTGIRPTTFDGSVGGLYVLERSSEGR